MKKNITELHENIIAQNLIEFHTIGGIRDESDFNNIKYHCNVTIGFIKIILSQYGGNKREIVKHLDKVLEDLEKFKVN